MIKLAFALLFLLQLLLVPPSHAASKYAPDGNNQDSIVTPSVATDGIRTDRVARTKEGGLVVCPTFRGAAVYSDRKDECLKPDGKTSGWVYPKDLPPPGKTYAGFRIVSGSYGYTHYEFYWK